MNSGGPEIIVLLVTLAVVALSVVLYFLPTSIAFKRQKANRVPIGVVNFFFGWTLLGWVGCLAWALSVDAPRPPAAPATPLPAARP